MPYKINEMGYIFLKIMEIEFNFDLQDPNAILDFIKRDKGEFRCSVYNPNFYPRAAKEIMDKLFTSDEQKKLKTLMTELKEAEVSLITNASSAVEEIMNKYKNEKNNVGELENEEDLSAFMTNVVCWIFEKIPSDALNLLGLIKINPEHFQQSYFFFEEMLNQLNQGNGRIYKQERIKKQFSEALKELENFVKKKKPTQPQSEQPKSNPERDTPVNSNKSPETQDNSENNQNPNGTNNPNSPNLTDLQTLKNQTIFEITNSLNQKPKLENSDLSSEYHNWESEITNFIKEEQITFFKKRILNNIQNQRKEKIKKQTTRQMSETINSNLQSALQPNATLQDKKEALTKNEQYEGEQSYEDKKEEIKKIKVEIAQDNPADYRNKFLNSLPSKITQYNLSQDELDVETKTEIKKLEHETDPNKLVEREVKIIQKIGQQGATKKITTFKKKINKVLDFNNKTKIDELKKQLIEFMKSNNIYYQAKKNEARELLRQLEISLTINNYDSSETLPFPIQIITGMGAILAVLFLTFLIWKKKRQKLFKNYLTKN